MDPCILYRTQFELHTFIFASFLQLWLLLPFCCLTLFLNDPTTFQLHLLVVNMFWLVPLLALQSIDLSVPCTIHPANIYIHGQVEILLKLVNIDLSS